MVCLGNICRSPLAEGILKSMVDSTAVLVDSAGTGGYHIGALPDERSIAVAQKNGLDITDQRARKLVVEDLLEYDLIYAMDTSNYQNILAMTTNEAQIGKIKLLLDEVDLGIKEVPDPYYGGINGFNEVFKMVHQACNVIARKLNK